MVESIIIKSYPYDGIFIDIGTPDDYLRLINEKTMKTNNYSIKKDKNIEDALKCIELNGLG